MEWKGPAARLRSIFYIRCALTGTWNGRSVNCPGLLLGPACTPSFCVGKVVCAFYKFPCQRVGVRGVGSREQNEWAVELPFPFVAEGTMESLWHVHAFDYFD
jgi:hypothetical protein